MTTNTRRLVRLFCCLLLFGHAVWAADPAKTVIQDTIYRADGTPATGTLVISWPAFVTADGKPVAAGSLNVKIHDGVVNLPLVPTQGATPTGTYYKVVFTLDNGASSQEYWSVPSNSPATISAIRSSVVPATVALQVVSREYVDSAIAAAVGAPGSPLALNRGGTGQNSWTSGRCVRVADGGASLESAPTDCDVKALTCTGTDKLSAIGTDGVPVCSADQTGAAGGGISTLNTLTGATQTFAKLDDTNVTLGIGSAGTTHTFTLGWTGTLGKARGGAGADMSSVIFPSSGTLAVTADLPSNEGGASNNFLTAYNSTTHAWSKARPTWANIDKMTSSLADLATRACANLSDAGGACSKNVGTTAGTVAAGDHAHSGYVATSVTVNGHALSGNVSVTASDVGLGNVTNTSDANKPVSTAQQTALDLKANIASPTFTGTVGGITATMVGLGNVTNTSDANKPVSTAQQTALDLKANSASPTFTGTVGGITAVMVGLGSVTNDAQTKSAVVPNTAPSAGQILAGNTDGTAYAPVSLSQDCTLGATGAIACTKSNNTAFGTGAFATIANYVPTSTTVNGHALSGNVSVTASDVGLGNVTNTSDADKPVSTAQQTALDLKANIASPTFTGAVGGITAAMVGAAASNASTTVNGVTCTLGSTCTVGVALSRTASWEFPAAGDSIPLLNLPASATITRVYCTVKSGTNIVFGLYKNAEATAWTNGTAVFSGDQTCTGSGLVVTSFSSAAVAAHTPLVISVTSATGGPTMASITVEYQ